MTTTARLAAHCLAAAVLLVGCGGGDTGAGGGLSNDPKVAFDEAVADGVECPELYDLRNEVDPSDPWINEANDTLREVGCFSSTATRTD